MTTEPTTTAAPAPLVAASLVARAEGVLLVGLAAVELLNLTGGRMTMGLTTAAFFAVFGVLLVAGGVLITRGGAWARGPILMTQLIGLGLAWNLRSGETTWLAVVLVIVCLSVIVLMVHPATIAALEPDDRSGPDAD